MISLAEMGHCNGCGSVRNVLYSTHTWDLLRALESVSPASCKTPATSIDSIRPNNHLRRNKNLERRSSSQQIKSYCLGPPTQNPGLREVDLEPSLKRGSDKINRLRPRRKNTTENKSYRTAWTHKREPSTQRGRLGTQC